MIASMVLEFNKRFLREVLEAAIHTAALTIASNVSSRLVDRFLDEPQYLPPYEGREPVSIVININSNNVEGVEVEQE